MGGTLVPSPRSRASQPASSSSMSSMLGMVSPSMRKTFASVFSISSSSCPSPTPVSRRA